MTRKHFEALADALASSRPNIEGYTKESPNSENTFVNRITYEAARQAWADTVGDVASVCARFNPNFDRGRFVSACEERFSA